MPMPINLVSLAVDDLTCERCSRPLPAGARANTRYCSSHCKGAARYARRMLDPGYAAQSNARTRAWERADPARQASRERRRYAADVDAARARATTARMTPQYRARQEARAAILRGDLVKEPCLFCDALKVHAHHHDYTRPLDVTWLCSTHHGLAHRRVP